MRHARRCVFDNKPRACDAVEASVLAGMAEAAMRQLEAAWVQQHSHISGLLRPPTAFSAATMLVDASQRAWRVLHLNAAVSAMTGAHPASMCLSLQSPSLVTLLFIM